MRPTEVAMPTMIEPTIPNAVVFFQKSSMTIEGRFAEATIAKASPTRNVTLTP